MEQLNRIELRGTVGSVKLQNYNDSTVAHFTLATNLAYKDKDGGPVIETSWHNVTAWAGKDIQKLDAIEKGSRLYVSGRLRYQKVTASDGVERTFTEIIARKLTFMDDGEQLQCEMN